MLPSLPSIRNLQRERMLGAAFNASLRSQRPPQRAEPRSRSATIKQDPSQGAEARSRSAPPQRADPAAAEPERIEHLPKELLVDIANKFLDSPVWHVCQLGAARKDMEKVYMDDRLWKGYFERRFEMTRRPSQQRSAMSRSPSPTSARLSYAHYHALERRFREGQYGKHDTLSGAKGVAVMDVRLSPLGSSAFAALRDGSAMAYDLAGTKASPMREYRPSEGCGAALCLLPEAEALFAGYSLGHLCAWRPTGEVLFEQKVHQGRVCALSRLEGRLLSVSSDSVVKAWDVESFDHCASFNGHGDAVVSVAAAWADGHSFLTGSHDRTVRLWDLRTGGSVAQWRQQDWVTCVDFHPTAADRFFSSDKSVHEWDLRVPGAALSSVHRHRKLVSRFRVDPLRLASCSLDGSVKVSSLEEVHLRHASPHASPRASPCHSRDASPMGSPSSRTSTSFHMESREQSDVTTLRASKDYVLCIDFDATRLLAGNMDGLVNIYDFSDADHFSSGPSPMHSPHIGHCGEPMDITMTGLELEALA